MKSANQQKSCHSFTARPTCADDIPFVMTVTEMSKILMLGRGTAYNLIKNGTIRSLRIGKTIRITRTALLEYINQ